MSVTRVLETTFAAAGFSLAISGALTTWVKASLLVGEVLNVSAAQGPLATNTGGSNSYSNQSAQLTAGASMLLIGFIIGVFHVVINIGQARGVSTFLKASLPLASFAFVCTLIGTIVSGAGSNAVNVNNVQNAVKNLPGVSSTVTWDTGFGCAIAATIAQFISALLAYISPASAPAADAAAPAADKPAEAVPAAVVVASEPTV